MHAERVAVLERKIEAQESEPAPAERDVAQMMTELRQAASGIPSAGERSSGAVNAAMDEIESELGSGSGKNGSLGDEIDGLSRARTRADPEADAGRKLEGLKRRRGRWGRLKGRMGRERRPSAHAPAPPTDEGRRTAACGGAPLERPSAGYDETAPAA